LLSFLLVSAGLVNAFVYWVVADGMTEVSFRRLPALLCLYWQVYLR